MRLVSGVSSLIPDRLFVRAIAYAQRRAEPELVPIVQKMPRGGTAIDVGAWYGPWSYWFAKRADRVIAFEPNPTVAAVVSSTAPPKVELRAEAVSDTASTATLMVPEGGRGTEGRASLERLADSGGSVEVKTTALDDLDLANVTIIKIDVEGHERQVLRGAQSVVATHKPVLVVEVEERFGGIAPTVDLLAGWGYSGYVWVGGQWVALNDFDLATNQTQYIDERPSWSYLVSVAHGRSKYVNNVVFVHDQGSWTVL